MRFIEIFYGNQISKYFEADITSIYDSIVLVNYHRQDPAKVVLIRQKKDKVEPTDR